MAETPSVTAVLLTADRPMMTARAIRLFLNNTYPNKRLLIYDNGREPLKWQEHAPELQYDVVVEPHGGRGIGALRNAANGYVATDIIIHFDSDDISGPHRIADQVEMLQESGAKVTGYRSLVFWREWCTQWKEMVHEAWAYINPMPTYAVNASLCYWRSTWEWHKFPPHCDGDSMQWREAVGPQNFNAGVSRYPRLRMVDPFSDFSNRMDVTTSSASPWSHQMCDNLICTIHGANMGAYDLERHIAEGSTQWVRRPDLDAAIRKIVEAA